MLYVQTREFYIMLTTHGSTGTNSFRLVWDDEAFLFDWTREEDAFRTKFDDGGS